MCWGRRFGGNHCAFLSCLFEAKIAPMKTIFKKRQEDGKECKKKKEREERKGGRQDIMLSFKCSLKIT